MQEFIYFFSSNKLFILKCLYGNPTFPEICVFV